MCSSWVSGMLIRHNISMLHNDRPPTKACIFKLIRPLCQQIPINAWRCIACTFPATTLAKNPGPNRLTEQQGAWHTNSIMQARMKISEVLWRRLSRNQALIRETLVCVCCETCNEQTDIRHPISCSAARLLALETWGRRSCRLLLCEARGTSPIYEDVLVAGREAS